MTKHLWSGSCDPGITGFTCGGAHTFSVGVYEIIPTKNGKGTKRGKTKVRIIGHISAPGMVYAEAKRIVELLDAGVYAGPKTIRV
jgi:hypothetical protein